MMMVDGETASHGPDVWGVLRRVAAEPSPGGKVRLLRECSSDELKRTLLYALDPYRTWGMAEAKVVEAQARAGSVQEAAKRSLADSWRAVFAALDELAGRKFTGNAAVDFVAGLLGSGLHSDAGAAFILMLNKDLRCGVQAKTANAAFPGLIPEYKVSLASPVALSKVRYPAIAEYKLDGKRVLADVGPEGTVLRSRNGIVETGYAHVRAACDRLWDPETMPADGLVLDGELMWGMFGDRQAQEEQAVFVVFDMVPRGEFQSQACGLPQQRRSRLVQDLLRGFDGPIEAVKGRIVSSEPELRAFYQEAIAAGFEGLVIKDPTACYQYKRGRHWMKLKPEETEDLPVVGSYEGTGKYAGMLGGIEVRRANGVVVGVGSGFHDGQRQSLWAERETLVGRVAEVKFQEATPDGSLRFPVFVRWRDDK